MKLLKRKHFARIGFSLAFFGALVPKAFAADVTTLSALGATDVID
jgi:hypothetical protein